MVEADVANRSLRRSVLIWGVAALGVLMVVLQNTTLEFVKAALVTDPTVHTFQAGLFAKAWSLLPTLRLIDWALFTAFAFIACLLVFLEVSERRLSRELTGLLAGERGTVLLATVLSAAVCRFYLEPGEFAIRDSPLHVAQVWATAESLAHGSWPSWSFYSYGGFPLLQFYGAGFFVLVGSLVAVTGNLLWPIKGTLFLLHAASALPIYFWSRAVGLARAGALIAATAYSLSFLHTHTIVWAGALPVSLQYLVFPATLWALERALATDSRRWLWALALTTFLSVATHHATGAFWLELLLVYLILRVLIVRERSIVGRRAVRAVLALVGGVVMNGGPLLRVAKEGSWVHLQPDLPLLHPAWPSWQFLAQALTWRNTWSGWAVAYIGLSIVILALIGAIRAFRIKRSDADPRAIRVIVVLAALAFSCAAGNERVINLALVFIVFVAGSALNARTSSRVCLATLGLLVLDLGPTTLQSPFRTDRDRITEGFREVSHAVGPHRTLEGYWSGVGRHYFHWGAYSDTGLIVPTGFFPQGAPQSLAAINALVDVMNAPDGDPAMRRELLYLWDVAALAVHSRDRFTTPEGEPIADGEPLFASTGSTSPLLYSRRAVIARDDSLYALQRSKLEGGHTASDADRRRYLSRLQPWIHAMGLDPEHASAAALLVWDDSSASKTESIPVIDSPSTIARGEVVTGDVLQLRSYDVELRRASMAFHAADSGYVQIAFSEYPSLRVMLDGRPIRPMRSVLGTMILPVDAGDHTVVLTPGSRWRLKSLVLVFAGVLIVFLSQARLQNVHGRISRA